MKVKSESKIAQSCLTLSDPIDHSLPGSSIYGILQAGVPEWGAIAFSDMQSISCEMLGWMKHKLELRLPGETSITSDMLMTPPLWQKVKRN